jgi:hypothetical protein
MIDITVDNNEVHIDMSIFFTYDRKDEMIKFIKELIDKAKFSGETIELFYIDGDRKIFVHQW